MTIKMRKLRKLKRFVVKLKDYFRPGLSKTEILAMISADGVYLLYTLGSDVRIISSLYLSIIGYRKLRIISFIFARKNFDPQVIFFESIDAVLEAY